MRILIDENIPVINYSLSKLFDTKLFSGRDIKNQDIRDFNPDAMFVRSTTMVNESLLKNSNIKFVAAATAGTDNLDTEYLDKQGIFHCNALGANSISVTEYVIHCLWKWINERKYKTNDLSIGVIGYGNIGRKTGLLCDKFGLKVRFFDPYVDDFKKQNSIEKFENLDSLIEKSNIISISAPLVLEGDYPTYYMIDKNIHLIKENSLIINVGRGGIINEKKLLAVKKKKNLTLCFDVWENEPKLDPDFARECDFATAHIAGYSHDGKIRATMMLIEEFKKYFKLDFEIDLGDKMKDDEKIHFEEVAFSSLANSIKNKRFFDEDYILFKEILTDFSVAKFDKLRKSHKITYESILMK